MATSTSPSTIGVRSDRIMYLASLASNAHEVDHYLAPLRELSRIRSKGDELTPEEIEVLDSIEDNIKHYLLESEHLRSFTIETLNQQLYERGEARVQIRQLRWRMAFLLTGAAGLVTATYMLPFGGADVRLRVAINASIALCYIIGAYLFFTSRRQFSHAHQAAYRLFGYAFIAGSLVTLTNLILTISYKGIVPWTSYWYLPVITYGTFVLMYLGAHGLASLYSVKGIAMKVWWVAGIACAGALALTLFPWAWELGTRSGVNSIGAFFAGIFASHGGWLMYKVWHLANPLYKAPTKALGLGMMCVSVAWTMIVANPILPSHFQAPISTISSLLFVVCAFLLIRAGYSLSRLSRS